MRRLTFGARMLILAIVVVLLAACAQAASPNPAASAQKAGVQGAAPGAQSGQGRTNQGSTPGAQGGAGQAAAPGAQGARPQGAAGAGGRAVPVIVAKAATGVISQTLSYASTIQSKDAVKLTPLVSGRIDSVKVNVSDALKAGDVIAQIEPTTFQAQVGQAQAAYTAAQQRLVRMQIGSRPEEIVAAQAQSLRPRPPCTR